MVWYTAAIQLLRDSGLFRDVQIQGAKVRAMLDETRFLDIHFDPTTGSYSYALIDLSLPYPGDKRLFGWDDFPHPGNQSLHELASFPHHFQWRDADGNWLFIETSFCGNIEADIPTVLEYLRNFVTSDDPGW